MAVNGKKTTIKMGQGKLRMKYPTWVNPNTEKKNSHAFWYIPFILT